MQVRFYETAADEKLRFAVIIAHSGPDLFFCRHKDRNTYEIPGGHREPGERIEACARRELEEETGAFTYTLTPLCAYSVTGKNRVSTGEETFGMLYMAEVAGRRDTLEYEMAEVVCAKECPGAWTYPDIQPVLLREARRRGAI
ncbi:MAG TPA: NUDIX domain-containing protein [Firmicutes bacterium]|nr:NUDIX domain-containing protein [Bacillota bacterium]